MLVKEETSTFFFQCLQWFPSFFTRLRTSMNIQYHGDFCFKITTKPGGRATEDVVIWTDAPEKKTGIRTPSGTADIVFLSHLSPDDEALSGFKGDPEMLYTPGEYSANGIGVTGIPSFRDGSEGMERGHNTIFVFDSEEIRLAFLGALGHMPEEKTIEKIGDPDILFVPISGDGTLSPKQTDELIRAIEPKVVIPMHYGLPGTSEAFCRETGCSTNDPLPRFTFKKKDLDGKNMEVLFLSAG